MEKSCLWDETQVTDVGLLFKKDETDKISNNFWKILGIINFMQNFGKTIKI